MKIFTDIESQNDYYWTTKKKEASRPYEEKMLSLVDGDVSKLTVTLHDDPYDHYYVYMVDSFALPEAPWMRYEFMLEYYLKEPGYEIYYGCKSVSEWESEHPFDNDIELAEKHWNEVKGEVIRVLNATFRGRDFSQELRPPDNANDYTYWPFWLRLNPSDDIRENGVRILWLIRNVYARHLGLPVKDGVTDGTGFGQTVKTRFTYNNYRDLVKRITNAVNKEIEAANKNDRTANKINEDHISDIFRKFIAAAEKKGWLYKDPILECAYRFQSCMEFKQSSGCAFMIESFMRYINGKIGKVKMSSITIPWDSWTALIISSEGNAWTPDAVKVKSHKQYIRRENKKKGEQFNDIIARITKEIASMIEE